MATSDLLFLQVRRGQMAIVSMLLDRGLGRFSSFAAPLQLLCSSFAAGFRSFQFVSARLNFHQLRYMQKISMHVLVVNDKNFLIMLLEILLPYKGMFVENGYMQKVSMHVLFVNDKNF